MERFAREDVLEVFRRFGVVDVQRAEPIDPTEEVFVVAKSDYERIEVDALTRALMEVLPHTKVWVTEDNRRWRTEAL